MSLDGITTHFLAQELDNRLSGGRIDKVYQPSRYDIYLLIRCDSTNYRLLLTANPSGPRIHLTESMRENPMLPPSFCMLLRKHLQGARIVSVTSPGYERIVEITVSTVDELGDRKDKRLIIEMMGRYSNVILVNCQDRIFDSLLHVDQKMSRVREIMPARPYVYPPAQGKLSPSDALARVRAGELPVLTESLQRPLEKGLQDSLQGFSPELCREICFLSGIDSRKGIRQLENDEIHRLLQASADLLGRIVDGCISPAAYRSAAGEPYYLFHALALREAGVPTLFPGISEAMDAVHRDKDITADFEQRKKDLTSFVRAALDHAIRRAQIHRADFDSCQDMERDQLFGTLILQNAYRVKPGDELVSVIDYEHPDLVTLEIPLDPTLSPAKNAQILFKRYAKLKSKRVSSESFLAEDESAIAYLLTLLQAIDTATDREDLAALADEMREGGLTSARTRDPASPSAAKNFPSHPGKSKSGNASTRAIRAAGKAASMRKNSKAATTSKGSRSSESTGFRKYDAPDGFIILCGRNNLQNDQLTLRTAAPDDLWFHVQKMPGTHVILRSIDGSSRPFTEAAILCAAQTAAFFSRTVARMEKQRAVPMTIDEKFDLQSLKIPVDYCPVKNVKKPSKAKPGMVVYDHYKTVVVAPIEPSKSR